ncbi:MAG: tyrosine-type recombinase/integrase [Sutterellaceae bacterium]|nr:tyrosine-type recombinase/integrase [Sutterellaceae bacterium]MDY2868307.1 tyrosine-type recombinase/integrase [Mesosutterella sp.]
MKKRETEVLEGTVMQDPDRFPAIPKPDYRFRPNPALAFIATLHPGTSRYTMTSKLNVIARWAGFKDLTECNWGALRYEHVLAFIAFHEAIGPDGNPRLSARSINCYVSAFKGVALQAYLLHEMDHDAMSRIKLVKSVRYRRLPSGRAISEDESEALLEAAEKKPGKIAVRDHAIICLLLGCGLRRAEAAGLELGRVDLADNSIRVIGKGDKERKVFMIPQVKAALEAWLRVRGTEGRYVFGQFFKGERFDPSGPLTPHSVGQIVQNYRRAAGLSNLTTHDLRRTFATRLLSNNVDISTVKNMMGHSSVVTTSMYDRRGEDAEREAASRIKL